MFLPKPLGVTMRRCGSIRQRRDRSQVGLPVQNTRGIFPADRCETAPALQDEEYRSDEEDKCSDRRKRGRHPVDEARQRDRQKNRSKSQERPEGLEKGIDRQLPPCRGNLGIECLHAFCVSQSGTFSRAIISSNSGRRRTTSKDDPFTRTSGTSGLAL